MRLKTYAILFIFTCIIPIHLHLYAQKETKSNNIARIDLGVEFLSKKEHTKSIDELIAAKEIAIRDYGVITEESVRIYVAEEIFLQTKILGR